MPAVEVDELRQAFSEMGTSATEEVLQKCVELCIVFGEDAEGLVDNWFTYSASKLGGSVPTIPLLETFEKEELSKKKHKQDGSIIIRTAETAHAVPRREKESFLVEYGTPTTKGNKRTRSPLEANVSAKRSVAAQQTFSPASCSSPVLTPSSTPSAKYATRKNRGDVVSSYGDVAEGNVPPLTIDVTVDRGATSYKHMFLQLWEKAEILSDAIEVLAEKLEALHDLEYVDVSKPAQDEVTVMGRISCDSNGRLNPSSVLLESSMDRSGEEVRLDVSQLPNYALFPGQVVAVRGTNPTGRCFMATELKNGKRLPRSKTQLDPDKGLLRLVVAAGPFTVSDNLLYEPLDDLLNEVERIRPHVLLLVGPIVDSNNEKIVSGNIVAFDEELSYEELALRIISKITTKTKPIGVEVIVTASHRDMLGDGVYPAVAPELHHSDVRVVSDPCFLNINGFTVATTSTDILMHLGKEEINQGTGGDRLGRLAHHIIEQQCFYPLYPPNEEMSIEYKQFHHHAHFPFTPDLLLLPSDLRYFIKNLDDCCVVNPERLAKGRAGGFYAVIEAHSNIDVRGKVLRI